MNLEVARERSEERVLEERREAVCVVVVVVDDDDDDDGSDSDVNAIQFAGFSFLFCCELKVRS